jgi:hypothetical protein
LELGAFVLDELPELVSDELPVELESDVLPLEEPELPLVLSGLVLPPWEEPLPDVPCEELLVCISLPSLPVVPELESWFMLPAPDMLPLLPVSEAPPREL